MSRQCCQGREWENYKGQARSQRLIIRVFWNTVKCRSWCWPTVDIYGHFDTYYHCHCHDCDKPIHFFLFFSCSSPSLPPPNKISTKPSLSPLSFFLRHHKHNQNRQHAYDLCLFWGLCENRFQSGENTSLITTIVPAFRVATRWEPCSAWDAAPALREYFPEQNITQRGKSFSST